MQHFFVPAEAIQGKEVVFPERLTNQIRHVLRLDETSDRVVVLDNSGYEFTVALRGNLGKQMIGEVIAKNPGRAEPGIPITLCFSLTKREKLEWIVQKGTELGVAIFRPFVSSRSLIRKKDVDQFRLARLESIAREAAEQSQRSCLPILKSPLDFEELPTVFQSGNRALIAWEQADRADHLSKAFRNFQQSLKPLGIVLVIGPEGGFSLAEAQFMKGRGAEIFSLGESILRMETAALASVAIVRHLCDAFWPERFSPTGDCNSGVNSAADQG